MNCYFSVSKNQWFKMGQIRTQHLALVWLVTKMIKLLEIVLISTNVNWAHTSASIIFAITSVRFKRELVFNCPFSPHHKNGIFRWIVPLQNHCRRCMGDWRNRILQNSSQPGLWFLGWTHEHTDMHKMALKWCISIADDPNLGYLVTEKNYRQNYAKKS